MRPAVRAALRRVAQYASSSSTKWIALVGTVALLLIADTNPSVMSFF